MQVNPCNRLKDIVFGQLDPAKRNAGRGFFYFKKKVNIFTLNYCMVNIFTLIFVSVKTAKRYCEAGKLKIKVMASAKFSNGDITIETFGSINGDMPQVAKRELVNYDVERLMCVYEEKRQYVERNERGGVDLYPSDTAQYKRDMQEIANNLASHGFNLI